MWSRFAPRSALIGRFYLYMGASSLGFHAPIWVLLFESRGLSFTEITLLDSVFFATIVAAEIPTGYIGDRIGRRNALFISSMVIGLTTGVFGFLHTFEGFLVVYLVWAVAITFRSGNDSAWLYDTLLASNQEGSFTLIRGRGFAALFAVTAAGSLAGGFLYELNPAYPFLATAVLNVTGGLVLLTMPEPTVDSDQPTLTIPEVSRNLRRLVTPPLRSFVGYVAVFLAIGWSVTVLIQPVGIRAGLTPSELGVLFAGLTVASAVAANYADEIERRVGFDRWLLLVPLGLGAMFFLPLALPVVAVPVLLLMRTAQAGTRPMVETYLNDRTPSLGRATVLSAYSMVVSVARVPIEIGTGIVADTMSLTAAISGLGGLLIAATIAIRVVAGPIVGPSDEEPDAIEVRRTEGTASEHQ